MDVARAGPIPLVLSKTRCDSASPAASLDRRTDPALPRVVLIRVWLGQGRRQSLRPLAKLLLHCNPCFAEPTLCPCRR